MYLCIFIITSYRTRVTFKTTAIFFNPTTDSLLIDTFNLKRIHQMPFGSIFFFGCYCVGKK